MFRSLTAYQCTQPAEAIVRKLDNALEGRAFAKCLPAMPSSTGFVKPLGEDSATITYETDGAILMCLRTDEKEVPGAAVKLLVSERADAMREKKTEDGQDVDLSKTDMRLIKEQIIEELLPTTLPRPRWTYAYLDKTLAMLFVAGSEEHCEHFVKQLGTALEAKPFVLLGVEGDPCEKFTAWMKDAEEIEDSFAIGHDCSLKHPKEGGTAIINVRKDDLDSVEMQAMLEAGKVCCRLALEHELMTFGINANLRLSGFSMDKDLRAELEEDDDNPNIGKASEFSLWVRAVRQVINDLEPLLGGWPKQEMLDLHDEQEQAA